MIWLSGLHVPASYLTALVQATCRRNGWPLDKSTLYTTVTNYTDPEEVNEHSGQGELLRLQLLNFLVANSKRPRFVTCSCSLFKRKNWGTLPLIW